MNYWRLLGNILLFICRALFDTHRLAKDVLKVWAEYLATSPPTFYTMIGWIALAFAGVFYVCWMSVYFIINRVITGTWRLS